MCVRRSHFQIISLHVCVCLACSPNSKRKHFALRLWRVCDRALSLSLADCLIGIRRSVRGERRGYIPVLVSSIAACSNMRTRMLKVRQTTSASNRYACNALAAPHREPPSKSHTPHTNHTHSIFQIECTFIISVSISFSLSRWLWYARSRVYIVVWCMRRVGVFWKMHAHTRNKHQLNMRRHTAAAHVAQSSQIKRTHTRARVLAIYTGLCNYTLTHLYGVMHKLATHIGFWWTINLGKKRHVRVGGEGGIFATKARRSRVGEQRTTYTQTYLQLFNAHGAGVGARTRTYAICVGQSLTTDMLILFEVLVFVNHSIWWSVALIRLIYFTTEYRQRAEQASNKNGSTIDVQSALFESDNCLSQHLPWPSQWWWRDNVRSVN